MFPPYRTQEEIDRVKKNNAELEQTAKDLHIEMEGCAKRESEHLVFTQKMSDKNARLQSENGSLSSKVNQYLPFAFYSPQCVSELKFYK